MKKHFLYAAALAALMTCACSVDPIDPVQPEEGGEFVVLNAGFATDGEGTRTVRQEDGKVFWSVKDEIAVIRARRTSSGGSSVFTSNNTAPAASASFSGQLPSGTGSNFWAIHPNLSGANYDGTYLVTVLPADQEAVPGTFADDLFISAAYFTSSAEPLSFYHVVGGIKFSVTEPGVEKVTLTANGGEALTGVIGIQNVSGHPTITAYGDTQSQIVLTPASGTFEVGKAYYFVTVPTTLERGFSLLFEKEDGSVAFRSTDQSVTISAAHFKTMMEVDKGLTYSQYFSFSPEEVSLSKAGDIFTIEVKATMGFHFDIVSDWIWEVGHEGNPIVGATYSFKASQNNGEERDGYILLCNDSGLGAGNCYYIAVHQAAGSPEDWKTAEFAHHSLGMRFTATWCGYCPIMNETFRMARQKLGDRFQYACFYSSSSGGNYGFSGINTLTSQYGVTGFPTGIIDGRIKIENYASDYASDLIVKAVQETESSYPTATGIGVVSSLEGSTVSVNVDVYAHLADSYLLTVLLLENGIIGYQNGYGDGFVHNKVVRKAFTSVSGNAFSISANEKKSFSFSTALSDEYDPDNLEILVYVQRPFGSQPVIQSGKYGDYYVDNCVSLPVGKAAIPDLK